MKTIEINNDQARLILQGLKRKKAEILRRYNGSVSQDSDLDDIRDLERQIGGGNDL